ncbi:MAG TPA: hypothetical protein VJB87_01670 [Candidatus Nanoarchaeia archaeon]|nr:hypothetical protein [Candidatus Nanoarchaeia archaeon]
MGYWRDVFGIVTLNDESYKRVANDPRAFKRVFGYFLLSVFLLIGVIGLIVLFAASFIVALFPESAQLLNAGAIIGTLFLVALVVFPFIAFIAEYIVLLIPYGIGLLCGGKPKKYSDFFTVMLYPVPIMAPLVLILGQWASGLYSIWFFVMLFKTYRIVHKLDAHRSGWAVGINALLYVIFFVTWLLMVISLLSFV